MPMLRHGLFRRWDNIARRIGKASKGECKIVIECSTIPVATGETMRKVQSQSPDLHILSLTFRDLMSTLSTTGSACNR